MSGRFNPAPLIRGLKDGLRLRRSHGDEPPDTKVRWALILIPGAALTASIATGIALPKADQLLAGTALLIGGLLASFSQLAGWREKLLERERAVDRRRIRALDEAAAHILTSVLVSVIATAVLVVQANLDLDHQSPWMTVLAGRILGGVGAAGFAYLALTLVIVVNLLWDAYQEDAKPSTTAPNSYQRKSG